MRRPRAGQPTLLQPAGNSLPSRAASRPNFRYVAAATAGIALALLLALVVLIFRHDWSGDSSPGMASPVDAGPNVAAPPDPDRNDRESPR